MERSLSPTLIQTRVQAPRSPLPTGSHAPGHLCYPFPFTYRYSSAFSFPSLVPQPIQRQRSLRGAAAASNGSGVLPRGAAATSPSGWELPAAASAAIFYFFADFFFLQKFLQIIFLKNSIKVSPNIFIEKFFKSLI